MSFSSRTSRRRVGFTLVELLVVIAIIGMLVALLVPAVQSARGTARTAQCASQIGELAKAMAAYETSKGSFPGYAQFVKRGQNEWATSGYDTGTRRVTVVSSSEPGMPFSWAAVLLRNIERQDIWDQIVDVNMEPEIRPIDVFICPSDTEATAVADRAALSYNANTGAWDLDDSGNFLIGNNVGDVADNGVMFNLAAYGSKKGPKTSIGGIRDGANMTILITENINKTYEPNSPADPPLFSWLTGSPDVPEGMEQQFGVVWVVETAPQPGNGITNQEGINRNADDFVEFDPATPRFARPASGHGSGVNVAFCDTHVKFLNDDIEYIVYQQLLTTNSSKCEDPLGHEPITNNASPAIQEFRTASPLSEADFE